MGEYSECVHKRSFGLTDSDVISRHSLKVAGSRDRLDRDSGIGPGLPTESTPGSLTPKIPTSTFNLKLLFASSLNSFVVDLLGYFTSVLPAS